MPVTVVQASAVIVVLPTQVYAGSTTKRTPAEPALPSANLTFIEKAYCPPGWRRFPGALMPS